MTITIAQTSFELIPTGEYPAVIDEIELTDGRYGEQLQFRFALLNQNEGRILLGWSTTTFSPNSKLYAWTRVALGGGSIPKEKQFASDEIIGKKVILVVIQKQGENGVYNRIDDLKPFKPIQTDETQESRNLWDE